MNIAEHNSLRLNKGQRRQFNYNKLNNEKWPDDVNVSPAAVVHQISRPSQ